MRLKIHILTILVGVLSVLSFYVVFAGSLPEAELPYLDQSTFLGYQGQNLNQGGAFLLPISEATYFPIRDTEVAVPELTAKSFLVYDTKNEKVIFSKEPGRILPIASLTKLLTAVVSIENLDPQEVVTITSDAFNANGEGGADFRLQEKFYFKDLLGAMLIKSSNDAALAVAKAVEQKTGENFAVLMNRQARQIGMGQSHFLDPAGLNDEGYSTAGDLLRLVKYSKNYPEIWSLAGRSSLDTASADGKFKHHFESTNKLWGNLPGLTGGKTGYTDGALGCMIIEENLSEQNTSLVIILLGSTDRFWEIKKISDWSKIAFRWK